MIGYQKNVIRPARKDTARYRQSLIAAGGTLPISTSRAIPPAFAAAKESTRIPNRSSLCLTPATAPLSAKTNVPLRSSATSRLLTRMCSSTIIAERVRNDAASELDSNGSWSGVVLHQPAHGVRRLRAVLHPILDAFVLQIHHRRLADRIVKSNNFHRAAVAGPHFVDHH